MAAAAAAVLVVARGWRAGAPLSWGLAVRHRPWLLLATQAVLVTRV